MKKTAVLALTICLFNLAALTPAPAKAAFLEDKVAEVIAMDPNAARIQELFKLKQGLDQMDKGAVVQTLLQAALAKNAGGVVPAVVTGGDLRQAAETVIRQQVQDKVAAQAGPYYKEVALLAMLLNNGQLLPKVAQDNNALAGAPANYRKMIQMTSTAYAPGNADNGKWGNRTYLGTTIQQGVVAVDPTVIPLGTKLWVEGYGEAVAEDTGSAIKGNRIDLAFNSRLDALNYGIKKVNVYVMN